MKGVSFKIVCFGLIADESTLAQVIFWYHHTRNHCLNLVICKSVVDSVHWKLSHIFDTILNSLRYFREDMKGKTRMMWCDVDAMSIWSRVFVSYNAWFCWMAEIIFHWIKITRKNFDVGLSWCCCFPFGSSQPVSNTYPVSFDNRPVKCMVNVEIGIALGHPVNYAVVLYTWLYFQIDDAALWINNLWSLLITLIIFNSEMVKY